MLSGKDRGKQGRVIEARPREQRVVVENLNIVKRHTRPQPMRDASRMGGTQMTPGGVIEKAAPIPISNVMLVCPTCNRADADRDDDQGGQGPRGARARLQARRLRPGDRQVMASP